MCKSIRLGGMGVCMNLHICTKPMLGGYYPTYSGTFMVTFQSWFAAVLSYSPKMCFCTYNTIRGIHKECLQRSLEYRRASLWQILVQVTYSCTCCKLCFLLWRWTEAAVSIWALHPQCSSAPSCRYTCHKDSTAPKSFVAGWVKPDVEAGALVPYQVHSPCDWQLAVGESIANRKPAIGYRNRPMPAVSHMERPDLIGNWCLSFHIRLHPLSTSLVARRLSALRPTVS